MVYYGQEAAFNGGASPANREARWSQPYEGQAFADLIAILNTMRTLLFRDEPAFASITGTTVFLDGFAWAFQRGHSVTLLVGQGQTPYIYYLDAMVTAPLTVGTVMREVIGCSTYTISAGPKLVVRVIQGKPQVSCTILP